MEFLSSTIPINSQISPAIPFLTWKSRINPSRLRTILNSTTSLHWQPSFSLYLFRSVPSRKFQISAHLGRPTKRQNYLRKKITHKQQQKREVSPPQNPVHDFDKVDIYCSDFDRSVEISENVDKRSSLDDESKFDSSCEVSKMGSLDDDDNKETDMELKKNKIGESIMWNKLESWVEQYKKDTEFWGIGTGPVFTVFQDSEGKVERVVVNEDEIMRRSRVDPRLDNESEDLAEVNFKISFGKDLAREMENGSNVIPSNSSVAKFLVSGEQSRFSEAIRGVTLKPFSFSRISKGGLLVLCGLFVVWAVREVLTAGKEDSEEYTRLEKEMLRRKIKARNEKEKMVKGSVEVMRDPVEPKSMPFGRPQLDKEELVNSIAKAKESNSEMGIVGYSGFENTEFKDKIEEIRAMARRAREIEKKDSLKDDDDGEDYDQALNEFSKDSSTQENELIVRNETVDSDEVSVQKSETQFSSMHNFLTPNGIESSRTEQSKNIHSDDPGSELGPHENSSKKKLRIIKSAEEAREYLLRKHQEPKANQEHEVRNGEQTDITATPSANLQSVITGQKLDSTDKIYNSSSSSEIHDFSHPSEDYSKDSSTAEEGNMDSLADSKKSRISSGNEVSVSNEDSIQTEQVSAQLKKHSNEERASSLSKENWIEKNFHEFEPIVQKIGVGFRDNYRVAREKANQELTDLMQLKSDGTENEFEWMKDERLREIVFKVRDNELSGRDPFHLMDEEDKSVFFSGLEKKVEQENEKLLILHEYFHSNIENLDYGADGISLYDPPEKIMPRWKVPPAERNPEFLNNFVEQKKTLVAESLKNSFLSKKTEKDTIQKPEEPSSLTVAQATNPITKLQKDTKASSKTIIESSDGSVRAGKKSGKEYWQHTKKWSEGFLESYNAETDPEVKAVMRDIGKDMDRWITEKEIQEAADIMNRIPEKGQKFIKQKLEKVRREMELFGPQAVVSKYREYADEKEEDYLWWLDLPCVLCIELYTVENGEQRVGFYSLEMAADLELDPKQYHVIAFEDASDCKNLCYIIQAHMEMLGNGNAFVVARPPKDAFREAKANGFSITVIRKGQLQLNIDQTLEEVEESIIEIGTKMYHDKITKDQSVDINGLMKGVFGFGKPAKRKKRSKRSSKRRIKP